MVLVKYVCYLRTSTALFRNKFNNCPFCITLWAVDYNWIPFFMLAKITFFFFLEKNSCVKRNACAWSWFQTPRWYFDNVDIDKPAGGCSVNMEALISCIVSVADIQVCKNELHSRIQNRAGTRRLTVTLNRKWWAFSLNYWDALEL